MNENAAIIGTVLNDVRRMPMSAANRIKHILERCGSFVTGILRAASA